MASTSNKVLSTGLGRRKSSRASVRLYSGRGEITVNGKAISAFFPGLIYKTRYEQPFSVTETANKYHATVKVSGGGTTGQLDSVVLGLARALVAANAKFKPTLRTAGLLTRDSRTRQRRMIGMGGKSRRKRQSPKR